MQFMNFGKMHNSGNKMTLKQLPGDDIVSGHCGLAARVLKGHSPKGRGEKYVVGKNGKGRERKDDMTRIRMEARCCDGGGQ